MACRNCNEMGHFARDCPQPKKPVDSVCYNCGEVCGYLARDCPKPPSAEAIARRKAQICYNCGECCGNLAKDCPKPPVNRPPGGGAYRGTGWRGRGGSDFPFRGGGRGGTTPPFYSGGAGRGRGGNYHQHHHQGSYKSEVFTGPPGTYGGARPEIARVEYVGGNSRNGAPCYNCQQFGHMSRDCPHPLRAEGTCFKCNQSGHKAKDCPNPAAYPLQGPVPTTAAAGATTGATMVTLAQPSPAQLLGQAPEMQ